MFLRRFIAIFGYGAPRKWHYRTLRQDQKIRYRTSIEASRLSGRLRASPTALLPTRIEPPRTSNAGAALAGPVWRVDTDVKHENKTKILHVRRGASVGAHPFCDQQR